jgi:DNA-binding transcriptional ArsR family regulator
VLETLVALGEPRRFRIVELLLEGPRGVNDIGDRLAMRQPQVSQHLKVLREAGVVEVRPQGQQRLYELRADSWRRLHEWVESYRQVWDERFAGMDDVIEDLKKKEKTHGRRNRKGR